MPVVAVALAERGARRLATMHAASAIRHRRAATRLPTAGPCAATRGTLRGHQTNAPIGRIGLIGNFGTVPQRHVCPPPSAGR
jgi:hypothetical protein